MKEAIKLITKGVWEVLIIIGLVGFIMGFGYLLEAIYGAIK